MQDDINSAFPKNKDKKRVTIIIEVFENYQSMSVKKHEALVTWQEVIGVLEYQKTLCSLKRLPESVKQLIELEEQNNPL